MVATSQSQDGVPLGQISTLFTMARDEVGKWSVGVEW